MRRLKNDVGLATKRKPAFAETGSEKRSSNLLTATIVPQKRPTCNEGGDR
jgi:hypothetical protein